MAAAIAAVEGLGAGRPLVLIAGGRDKGSDFRPLRAVVQRCCSAVLLIGEAAPQIRDAIGDVVTTELVGDLASAVTRARALAVPGTTVLLSPACASFDQFASYAARGDAFRAAVRELTP